MPTEQFDYTGGWQKFNVPAGVKWVDVVVRGGSASGGDKQGGRVEGKLKVDGKDVLFIMVGRRGEQNTGASGGGAVFGGGGPGGNAAPGKTGGDGGGGASAIRMNAKDGRIAVVAGGAGGKSGDGGEGGRGGGAIGEHGSPAGAGSFGNSTGGTQAQPGRGGTSGSGTPYDGKDGESGRLGRGGRGGNYAPGAPRAGLHGGGGGGGGFYAGGGGQAADIGTNPGGGGAGGSNYTEPLASVIASQGGGGTDHGHVTLSWLDPDDPNNPPVPPDNITIDGHPISNGLATKATHKVTLKGTPDDPDHQQGVRIVVRMSRDQDFSRYSTHRGTFDQTEQRDVVELDNLERNTRYWLRIYTEDKHKRLSTSYRATNFWTNRPPNAPQLVSPVENAQLTSLMNVPLTWNGSDPDPSDPQNAAQVRWRRAGTPSQEPGPYSEPVTITGTTETYVVDAGTYKGNTFYEWTARTQDQQNAWGPWQTPASFYITADSTPPALSHPIRDEAIVAAAVNRFQWRFKGPQNAAQQTNFDFRYRVIGTPDWITVLGMPDPDVPGSNQFWDVPADTFEAGFHYEWQGRTDSSTGPPSDWTDSETFWTTEAPGSGAGIVVVETGLPAAPLGVGHNRLLIFDRGGKTYRGEIGPLGNIKWDRRRDDISVAQAGLTEWRPEDVELLSHLRTWMHEAVIYRDRPHQPPERVWEGPLTRIALTRSKVELEAQDVMAYVKRRIMRQGYNDSYRVINGQQIGLRTVVDRAAQIILNALAYDDMNVIAYLTPFHHGGDAKQSRVVKDYQKTAFEEVDDMAALAGLDYATSGRRVMLWDTHVPLGRLPEMRDGDFSDEVILTEYGMSAANYVGSTNTNGIWGAASRGIVDGDPGPTGFIEMLMSSYGENDGAASDRTLSKTARKRLEEALAEQAERNISNRWPPPVVVRVPDNTTLNPNLNIGINQLVPGVWIPVRTDQGIREFAQWQKLDRLTVTEDAKGEKVNVVMSPAPNGGQDPDAELEVEE